MRTPLCALLGIDVPPVIGTDPRNGKEVVLAANDGEPFAALWASESPIYGRFGYGLATEDEAWEKAHRTVGAIVSEISAQADEPVVMAAFASYLEITPPATLVFDHGADKDDDPDK